MFTPSKVNSLQVFISRKLVGSGNISYTTTQIDIDVTSQATLLLYECNTSFSMGNICFEQKLRCNSEY